MILKPESHAKARGFLRLINLSLVQKQRLEKNPRTTSTDP
jgi:hypothetical protein